jgi:hypothetical protein
MAKPVHAENSLVMAKTREQQHESYDQIHLAKKTKTNRDETKIA